MKLKLINLTKNRSNSYLSLRFVSKKHKLKLKKELLNSKNLNYLLQNLQIKTTSSYTILKRTYSLLVTMLLSKNLTSLIMILYVVRLELQVSQQFHKDKYPLNIGFNWAEKCYPIIQEVLFSHGLAQCLNIWCHF